MEDEGSVLKYMTKSEIEEQRSSLLIMTQRHFIASVLILLQMISFLTIGMVFRWTVFRLEWDSCSDNKNKGGTFGKYVAVGVRIDVPTIPTIKALCHNEQTAALLLNFGYGHVLQYTPFILHFSALHFTHSFTT